MIHEITTGNHNDLIKSNQKRRRNRSAMPGAALHTSAGSSKKLLGILETPSQKPQTIHYSQTLTFLQLVPRTREGSLRQRIFTRNGICSFCLCNIHLPCLGNCLGLPEGKWPGAGPLRPHQSEHHELPAIVASTEAN